MNDDKWATALVEEMLKECWRDYVSGRYSLNNYNYGKDSLQALNMARTALESRPWETLEDARDLVAQTKIAYEKLHSDAEGFGAGILVSLLARLAAREHGSGP